MNTAELNELAQYVHKCNEKWWQDPVTKQRIERNKGELLMLVITELAEACEGERKNLMDDKLPHRKMAEVEMADAAIRLLDFAAGFGYKLVYVDVLIDEKMPDNKGKLLLDICNQIVLAGDTEYLQHHIHISWAIGAIQAYCIKFDYDLYGAIKEKLAYNSLRADHTHEARLKAGGKQW